MALPIVMSASGKLPHPLAASLGRGKKKCLQIWSVVLIASTAALVPFLVILLFLCYYKRMQGKEKAKAEQEVDRSVELSEKKMATLRSSEDPERMVELEFLVRLILVFDLDDSLRASTEVLGKGKLGSTYKATLELGSVVAVKKSKKHE
ncbi:hypothetical protein Pint_17835 [Pistacia integerrima]|uniref:Uncharacterized protein n=1 Tax=Pistacia integerrima TaxID=434235 RepID=A0ACC0YTX8_9ROSI|nr:hypothetical protein Pint_17835 [Pistacia integerrima]